MKKLATYGIGRHRVLIQFTDQKGVEYQIEYRAQSRQGIANILFEYKSNERKLKTLSNFATSPIKVQSTRRFDIDVLPIYNPTFKIYTRDKEDKRAYKKTYRFSLRAHGFLSFRQLQRISRQDFSNKCRIAGSKK